MLSMNRLIIVLVLALVIETGELHSQCDCPGNVPPPMLVISGPINNGRLMASNGEGSITASYSYSQGKNLYSHDSKQANKFEREYSHNYIGLYANYALTNRIGVGVETAFFSANVKDVYENKDYSKLSHLSLSGRYNLFTRDSDDEFIINAGIKFPLNSDELDTTGLAKPASSAFGFLLGSVYNLMLNSQMNLITSANYDLNLANSDGTKIGNGIYTQMMLRDNNINNFAPSLSLAFDYRMKDKYKEINVQNSGGYTLNIVPAVAYSIESISSAVNLSCTLPLYRNLEGYQSGKDFAVQLSISYGF